MDSAVEIESFFHVDCWLLSKSDNFLCVANRNLFMTREN